MYEDIAALDRIDERRIFILQQSRHARSPVRVAQLRQLHFRQHPESIKVERSGQLVRIFLSQLEERQQNLAQREVGIGAELDPYGGLVAAEPDALGDDLVQTCVAVSLPL